MTEAEQAWEARPKRVVEDITVEDLGFILTPEMCDEILLELAQSDDPMRFLTEP